MRAHERLRQQRIAEGLTQVEMAERLEITLRHYCGLEAGDRTPSLRLGARIQAEFGVPISTWVDSAGGVDGWTK